ncbi:hypothetical protein MAM1_1133d11475 [Mucor ambiguus]|uniref:Helitron helicase-like domain-containing protein n=1 Tax=Mucor ambiguus TaxID=91626 RepID=A0A0C9NAQ8_9FUNG|nr:hypothetical protein MAM1_1133d11475 [Mucor ambiguus]
MVPGPCGLLNSQAICTKKYPFNFANTTTLGEENKDGKLAYRRTVMSNRVIMRGSGQTTVDNRWIVPHNLYLAAKYNDAHINVEICTQVNSIKYVYKGHDRAQVHLDKTEQDKINNLLDARYVSASEACLLRILSYPMHKEFSSCQRLDVYLPGNSLIYCSENDHPSEVLNRDVFDTTLTAWFKYNSSYPDDEAAMPTLYPNFCEMYAFHKTRNGRFWAARRAGFGGTIGRIIYTISPRDNEKHYLRLLLLHVPGAKSFADLRTVDGVVHNTFQAAACGLGLLAEDNEWSAAMTEAALTQPPSALRQLFCILVAFSGVSDPFRLWLDHQCEI